MTNIYADGRYLESNPSWHSEDSSWKAGHIHAILQDNKISPTSICEVGCGAGQVLTSLASSYEPFVQFSGFEISPQAYEICRKSEQENLRFTLGNLLERSDLHFDVALAIDVFEHAEDYFGFLRRINERAVYKVFHIPLDLSVQALLRPTRLMHARDHVGHIHYFTKETALATLIDSGHEIIDWRFTNGALELPVESVGARVLNIPRRIISYFSSELAARLLGGFSLLVLTK